MNPLFSLYTRVSTFASPLQSEQIKICSDGTFGVCLKNGTIAHALSLPEEATVADAVQLALAHPDDLYVVTMDETNQPKGLVTLSTLLAIVTEVYSNQAVLLDTLLATMSEATTIVDKQNTVLYWNPSAEKIYEISREDVVGVSLETHFASDSIRLKEALSEGTILQRVYHVPRPDRHVLINTAPVRKNGEIIGALSIEQDITELVRLNQELADTTAHLQTLKQEMSRFQAGDDPFFTIKGHSAAIQAAIQTAKKVAQTDATVLLFGESGVGKELFAQAIHQASRRRDQPFVAINCAAIPAALFESELFGYQGGSFTGAEKKGKPGKLELAHGGTLFLDEIGELPLELQVKLLRALQERKFYRVGGTEPITVNTRIVAATNRDLEEMVAQGRFREDLFYRLNVFSLEIPPLRERKEDILELVQIFIHEYSITHEQPVPRISPEVMQMLYDYAWPGNIRQLRNVMERLSILQEGGVILLEHLPASIRAERTERQHEPLTPLSLSAPRLMPFLPEENKMNEKERILAALERTYGNKKAAADMLGISRGTLYNKMRKYGIEDER
ncbi:sigma-54 interaction domain-containing protein [Brevibacillus migulae]|uniref:sigma-54 interaction domain-containing protein n=1 Tax=Brevibacillus migulae TaxID=1644114 RepID=UPI00106EB729|nr:sigma 54-interacting transcriptional regulator [Brevibacillus migulae]